MRRRILALLFLASSSLVIRPAGPSQPGSGAKAFVNGQWFTGKDFRRTTFYAVDGILTQQKPSTPIETVDLQAGLSFQRSRTHMSTFLAQSKTSRAQTVLF